MGLRGNFFARSFKDFGELATHGWFQHFWQLCDRYQVVFCIVERYDNPLLQKRDQCLMDMFINTNIYTTAQLRRLNQVWKFLKVHSLADILLCDGRNVNPVYLTRAPGCSSRQFPTERPLPSDLSME